jgi:KRAB domain-containing zinc finger protein
MSDTNIESEPDSYKSFLQILNENTASTQNTAANVSDFPHSQQSVCVNLRRNTKTLDNRYSCKSCNSFFTTLSELQMHLQTVHGHPILKCNVCNIVFISLYEQKQHRRTHHTFYHCSSCEYKCNTIDDYNMHTTTCEILQQSAVHQADINATGIDFILNYLCDLCGLIFPTFQAQQEHVARCTLQCTQCEFKTCTRSDLDSHVKIHEKDDVLVTENTGFSENVQLFVETILSTPLDDYNMSTITCEVLQSSAHQADINAVGKDVILNYSCDLCGLTFSTIQAQQNHVASVTLQCTQCEFKTCTRSDLDFHVKTHQINEVFVTENTELSESTQLFVETFLDMPVVNTEYRYFCKKCTDRFKTENELKNHLQTIHLCPIFFCNLCNKSYITRRERQKHLREDHEIFDCNLCNFKTYEIQKLTVHVSKKHMNIKKLNCRSCNFQANDIYHLRRHENFKHSDFAFMCAYCDYKTDTKPHLLQHFQCKHSGFKVQCPKCSFSTAYKHHLTSHLQKMH